MYFQHISLCPMKPSDDYNLVSNGKSLHCFCERGVYLAPDVRRSLGALFGSVFAFLDRRSNHTNRVQQQVRAHEVAPVLESANVGLTSAMAVTHTSFSALAISLTPTTISARSLPFTIDP